MWVVVALVEGPDIGHKISTMSILEPRLHFDMDEFLTGFYEANPFTNKTFDDGGLSYLFNMLAFVPLFHERQRLSWIPTHVWNRIAVGACSEVVTIVTSDLEKYAGPSCMFDERSFRESARFMILEYYKRVVPRLWAYNPSCLQRVRDWCTEVMVNLRSWWIRGILRRMFGRV